jgi:hypothetical protein
LSDQRQAEIKELIDAQPRSMDCAGREPLPSMCIVPLSQPGDARLARDYQGAGWIGFDPDGLIEILRIANAIGKAAAQSSAMTQNPRGPRAP